MEQVGLSRGAGHDMFVKWPVHRMFLKPDAFALRTSFNSSLQGNKGSEAKI